MDLKENGEGKKSVCLFSFFFSPYLSKDDQKARSITQLRAELESVTAKRHFYLSPLVFAKPWNGDNHKVAPTLSICDGKVYYCKHLIGYFTIYYHHMR